MPEEKERIFVGNGKEKQLQYGPIIDITIDIDSILREFDNGHGFTTDQGKRKMKLKICGRKEPDQYGNTHFVEVDTWKPNQNQNNQQSGQYASFNTPQQSENNSPPAGKQYSSYSSYNAVEPKMEDFKNSGSFNDDVPF